MIFLRTSEWISIIWFLFSFDSVHLIILDFFIRFFYSSILIVLRISHKNDLWGSSPFLVSGKYSRRSRFSRTRSQMFFVKSNCGKELQRFSYLCSAEPIRKESFIKFEACLPSSFYFIYPLGTQWNTCSMEEESIQQSKSNVIELTIDTQHWVQVNFSAELRC